ncbi:MAG: class I SAM-dependent methyltransferase [Alphaproteobacteria bacterium]|nr:class I SAM-dependent methyltransferase [Alphaproteobacteria bacterium]
MRDETGDGPEHRLLSFGCSIGDEILALRRYFPQAAVKGIDINPANVAVCRYRTRRLSGVVIETAGSAAQEPANRYDAIFCLAVLCNGTLTAMAKERCDPVLYFDAFARAVADMARCVKPGGLLCLTSTNFRFCDTTVASGFDVIYRANEEHISPDLLYDRNNRLMKGARYAEVVFRKR